MIVVSLVILYIITINDRKLMQSVICMKMEEIEV